MGADLRRPFHDHEVTAPKTERQVRETLGARHSISISQPTPISEDVVGAPDRSSIVPLLLRES
jgi:hypothetical protein